jgi:catechol 2,3-dioxygenase-like lactoylglutathione lyase family enzyme
MSTGKAMTKEKPTRARLGRPATPTVCLFLVLAAAGCSSTRAQTARPKIVGISSVRITVSDDCKAVDFYSAVLGEASPDEKNCAPSGPPGKLFFLGSGQELRLQSAEKPDPHQLVNQFGFVTADVPALLLYLKSQGVRADSAEGAGGIIRVQDPEGHLIEFVDEKRMRKGDRRSPLAGGPERMIHVGFIVSNQEKMEQFYQGVLGFRPYWHGGMKDDKTDWLSLQVPDGTDWVEFMLHISPDADRHLIGVMNHIALGVKDIHQAREQLVKRGVHLTEEPKIGRDGKWQLNLYDPDQTRVELMEFTPVEKPCCSEYTGPHPKP